MPIVNANRMMRSSFILIKAPTMCPKPSVHSLRKKAWYNPFPAALSPMTIRSVKRSSVFWSRKNYIDPSTNPSRISEEASVVSCFSTTPSDRIPCCVIVHPTPMKRHTSSVSTKTRKRNNTLSVRKEGFSVFCLQNGAVLTFPVSLNFIVEYCRIRWYIKDS